MLGLYISARLNRKFYEIGFTLFPSMIEVFQVFRPFPWICGGWPLAFRGFALVIWLFEWFFCIAKCFEAGFQALLILSRLIVASQSDLALQTAFNRHPRELCIRQCIILVTFAHTALSESFAFLSGVLFLRIFFKELEKRSWTKTRIDRSLVSFVSDVLVENFVWKRV